MALAIRKQSSYHRSALFNALMAMGGAAFIVVPFYGAIAVHSPARLPHATAVFGAPELPMRTNCKSSSPTHPSLTTATSPHLRKLAQYERVCQSSIVSRLSFFTALPTSVAQAHRYAHNVSAHLQEFHKYGIDPMVFLEPTTPAGLVDMAAYRAGDYDDAVDAYFAAIKAAGVTDEMMGTWVPFPEGNLPVWTSVNPDVFRDNVIKTATYQKRHFPASKVSIMLDSVTYPRDNDWTDGSVVSLRPYVRQMSPGLIDSIGLQGFPWEPSTDQIGATNGMPHDYLRIDLAVEAARILQVNDIWLNTGTYSVKYAGQHAQQVTMTSERRHALLRNVVMLAKALQVQRYNVAVHLFAEDKSNVAEGTDWSYWHTDMHSASTDVFKAFAHDLQSANVPLWLFDTE